MVVLYLLYYWLEYFDPFYVYIYREPTYIFNSTFFISTSVSITVLVIAVILMITLNNKKMKLKTYQSIFLSFLIPGLGQAGLGYLSWGILLFTVNILYWIIQPLPWIRWEWIIYVYNLFDCLIKTDRINMKLPVVISLILLNMFFPGMGQVYSGAITKGFIYLTMSALGAILIFWIPISGGNIDNGILLIPYLFILSVFGFVTYLPMSLKQLKQGQS